MDELTVSVLGAGYVGLTTAALLACAGATVYLLDPNEQRLKTVANGKSFFYEQGLDALLGRAVKNGRLRTATHYQEAIPLSDIVISAVGTPDNPDGSSNLNYVFAAANEAARLLKPPAIYVQKSTVPVGTGAKIIQLFEAANLTNAYVSNPEFLREGTAIQDSLWFDRVVVGGADSDALARVTDLYKQLEGQRQQLAELAGITPPSGTHEAQYVAVNLESAELIKVVSNAFLALKISFANSIALLADKVGADIVQVMDTVGMDRRIGGAFLRAGRGYGGGCFPKDVSGLLAAGLEQGVELEIMRAAQTLNESMPGYIIEKLQQALGGSLEGKKVSLLGLAFKAGTSDTRRSPGITMANLLVKAKATVVAYDPAVADEARPALHDAARIASTIEEALKDAEAVVVATDWPEFLSYPPEKFVEQLSGSVFLDTMNCFDGTAMTTAGMRYIGIGRN